MGQARVSSLDAVRDWRAALIGYQCGAQEALSAVEMDIRHAFDWLADQQKIWQAEIRRREDQVLHAKNDLWRRKMLPVLGKEPDCTEQMKALRKAQMRLEEAHDKLEATRRWHTKLQRAVDEYEAPGRQLAALLDYDLGQTIALVDQKIASLEAYMSLTAPSTQASERATPETPPASEEPA
jgi:hypothetical protein